MGIKETVKKLSEKGLITEEEAISIWASNIDKMTSQDIIDIIKYYLYQGECITKLENDLCILEDILTDIVVNLKCR